MNKIVPIPKEKRTVFTKTGIGDLGQVTTNTAESLGIFPGPIRLLQGVEGAKGGFGLAHIDGHADRVKQLQGLGYNETVSYVYHVVSDYDAIAIQEDGRLVFVREFSNLFNHVICQWDEDLSAWSVTTAIPKKNIRNLNIKWRKVA